MGGLSDGQVDKRTGAGAGITAMTSDPVSSAAGSRSLRMSPSRTADGAQSDLSQGISSRAVGPSDCFARRIARFAPETVANCFTDQQCRSAV